MIIFLKTIVEKSKKVVICTVGIVLILIGVVWACMTINDLQVSSIEMKKQQQVLQDDLNAQKLADINFKHEIREALRQAAEESRAMDRHITNMITSIRIQLGDRKLRH